jgi:hypothetical protein
MGKKNEAASEETITKSDAVRRALADGVDSPSDGVAYIKSKFGLDITNQQFSTVKFQEGKKKAGGKAPAKRGRPAASPSTNGVPNMALQIEAIKTLVDQLGVDQVVSIARLFAK